MDPVDISRLNTSISGNPAYQFAIYEAPLYKEYKPPARDLVPLPRTALYLLMAAMVVVAVAYAIVGHLMKDLAHDILDWALGPDEEMVKANSEAGEDTTTHMPQGLTHSHPNAFHVWDQDDVVIPLSPEHCHQTSPLLAVVPFRPHFFPSSTSHSVINSPALPQIQSGETKSPNKTPQEAYVFPSPKITGHRCTVSNVSFHDRKDGSDKV